MKIMFKYMNFSLGFLTFENNDTYVYNSNIEEEQKAKKATFGILDYSLYNSNNIKSKKIFKDFLQFLNQSSREDIVKYCNIKADDNDNIKADDNDFQKLLKMANKNLSLGAYSLSLI